MDFFQVFTLLVCLAAAFSYLNHRLLRLPPAIGIMTLGMVFSGGLMLLDSWNVALAVRLSAVIGGIDFSSLLLKFMLNVLLFAGALHVDTAAMKRERWPIFLFSTVGVVLSTFIVGGLFWLAAQALGAAIPLIYCLLFGALISPTDPIAVLSILRTAGASEAAQTKITGESLFNDGVAVVVFIALLSASQSAGGGIGAMDVAVLFVQEAIGGIVFGVAFGYAGYLLLKSIDDYRSEMLITLALVLASTVLSQHLHLSGPLAVVVIGLLMSSKGRSTAMSDTTREYIDRFWEMTDELMNAVLFLMIGLDILLVHTGEWYMLLGVMAIFISLAARWLSVASLISLLRLRGTFGRGTVAVLTWGGIRGGISVAMALSLPQVPGKEAILTATYLVVIFSIVVQGLTLARVVQWYNRPAPAANDAEPAGQQS